MIRDPAGEPDYFVGTIRNHYLHSVRGKARACTVYLDQSDVEKLQELGPVDNSTDEAILAHSDAEFVRNVLASLPEETRRVIVLHYFESLSIREIAALLARTPDSIKCNLYYARKVLAKRLGKALGRAALAIAALLFGGSLLYAAAVATGLAPSPFAADEESEVVFNAKSTEDTEDSLTGLTGFTGLSEAGAPPQTPNHESRTTNHETQGDSPQQFESITVNSNANNEENAMNTNASSSIIAAAAMAISPIVASSAAYEDEYFSISDAAVVCKTLANRVVYVFTNAAAVASVTAKQPMTLEEVLVVGGGGAGGWGGYQTSGNGPCAGGGGGGGVVFTNAVRLIASGGSISVSVGAGGDPSARYDAEDNPRPTGLWRWRWNWCGRDRARTRHARLFGRLSCRRLYQHD